MTEGRSKRPRPRPRHERPAFRCPPAVHKLTGVYLPKHFAARDRAAVEAFVDAVGGDGRLRGHLALANPQWRSVGPDTVALAIVHGPQAYVSPSWYPSTARHGKVVPTWNYVSVHFTGPLTIHRDAAWLRELVGRLTARHEAGRPSPWHVSDAPRDFIDGQLRAIVGVELAIATVEAKEKLSQNRDAEDRAGALDGLRGEPGPGPAAIADLMTTLPPPRR